MARLAELEARLAALEARQLELKDLPMPQLMRRLGDRMQPSADQFLLPKSVGPDSLADGAVTTAAIANDAVTPAKIDNFKRGSASVSTSAVSGPVGTAVVSHGMDTTPLVVLLTGSGADFTYTVSAITATQFTITMRHVDGTATTTTTTVGWLALG